MSDSNQRSRDESRWLTSERIDACCDDFELAWQRGDSPLIEDFLSPKLGAARPDALGELIKIELDYRVHRGLEGPDLADLLQRFPDDESMIRKIVDEHPLTARGGSTRFENGKGPIPVPSFYSDEDAAHGRGSLGAQGLRSRALGGSNENSSENNSFGRFDVELPASFGKFELLRVVGRGGMGVVYEARQIDADRLVALKLIRRDRLEGLAPSKLKHALQRFQQEAKVAAGIHHPHWVTVFDAGEVDGQPYYAMQLVNGPSMAEIVRVEPLEGLAAARYLLPVVEALTIAHENQIIHRDVKPHNLLVDSLLNHALIADFGLAKLRNREGDTTCTGEVFGSPSYLSPEQAQDASRADERSDIYGVGATLYHMVTGRPPFQSPDIAQTIKQVLEREPIEPRRLVPHLDRDLETICLKCLRKEPRQRYATTDELASELRSYLENKPIKARPLSRLLRTWRWARRNPVVASLETSVGLLAIALIITFAWAAFENSRLLKNSNQALEQERIAKRELFDSLFDYVDIVSSEPMMSDVGFQPLREELLENTADHLAEFTTQSSSSDLDQIRAAQIWTMLARVHFDSGRGSKARESAKRAIELVESSSVGRRELTEAMIESKLILAELAWERSRSIEAIEMIESIQNDLIGSALDSSRESQLRLQATALACEVYMALGKLDAVEDELVSNVDGFETLRHERDESSILAVASIHEARSQWNARRLAMEEALNDAAQAVASWEPILDQYDQQDGSVLLVNPPKEIPPVDFYRQRLRVAQLLWGKRDIERAVDDARELANELDDVTRKRPTALEYQIVFANTLSFLSQSHYRKGNVDEYARLIEKLEKSIGMLVSVDAKRRSHRIAICNLLLQAAYVDQVESRFGLCEQKLRVAYSLSERSTEEDQQELSLRLAIAGAIEATFPEQSLEWYSQEETQALLARVRQFANDGVAHLALAEQLADFISKSSHAPFFEVRQGLDPMERPQNATVRLRVVEELRFLKSRYPSSSLIRFLFACETAQSVSENEDLSIEDRLHIIEENVGELRRIANVTNRLSERHTLGVVLHEFALVCIQSGQQDRAYSLAVEAEAILIDAIFSFSDQSFLRRQLASLYYLRACIDLANNRIAQSHELFVAAANEFDLSLEKVADLKHLEEELIGSWIVARCLASKLDRRNIDYDWHWEQIRRAITLYKVAEKQRMDVHILHPAMRSTVLHAMSIVESSGDARMQLDLLDLIGLELFEDLGWTGYHSARTRARLFFIQDRLARQTHERRDEDFASLMSLAVVFAESSDLAFSCLLERLSVIPAAFFRWTNTHTRGIVRSHAD